MNAKGILGKVKAVSEQSNSSNRLGMIDKVSQVIADSRVLASTEQIWDGIEIVHFRHTLKEIAAVVHQQSVGKTAKSCQDQDSEAKPARCAAVLPKRLCSHIQLK